MDPVGSILRSVVLLAHIDTSFFLKPVPLRNISVSLAALKSKRDWGALSPASRQESDDGAVPDFCDTRSVIQECDTSRISLLHIPCRDTSETVEDCHFLITENKSIFGIQHKKSRVSTDIGLI